MDSLLANYASSDDEVLPFSTPSPPHRIPPVQPVHLESIVGEENDESIIPKSTSQRGGIVTSLPPPKPFLFNSFPPPRSNVFCHPKPQPELERQAEVDDRDERVVNKPKPKPSSTSFFSSLPLPKSSSSTSDAKKVVKFRPPEIVYPTTASFNDEDKDSDEGEQERQRMKSKESTFTSSATSFLSSIPAPKHSTALGSLTSASGRRSMVETDTVSISDATGSDSVENTDQSYELNYGYSSLGPEGENRAYYSGNGNGSLSDGNSGSDPGSSIGMENDAGMNQVYGIYDHSSRLGGDSSVDYNYYVAGCLDVSGVGVTSNVGSYGPYGNRKQVGYTNYGGSYGDYCNNAWYENNLANTTDFPDVSVVVENSLPVPRKRGRKDVPPEIIEVKQDELMKNRPREDQVKLTGIAFGPAYQPASTKGKPTKLHKRKHQIGSLYFDMRQKEMELAERRSKGLLTKAQTQAKYGW